MRNVFLLYMPTGNAVAMANYRNTIKNPVSLARIAPLISREFRSTLVGVFGSAPFAVWGSAAGKRNRSNFDKMAAGDDIIIVEGNTVRLLGKVAAKLESKALSRELWPAAGEAMWELVYFIANAKALDLPLDEFRALLGYNKGFLHGFMSVDAARLAAFYAAYDDLYSVLLRVQQGLSPIRRPEADDRLVVPAGDLVEVTGEAIDEVIRTRDLSDHVRMQFKLARLGIKAGERVWVPVGDQGRLRKAYDFDEFDPEFTAGIDLPHSYVENIDVVWKQEFRIGAAYEIENSTSIYSGLLRFADLNVIAPNTTYPMFVVAPRARKSALRNQLLRPTFKRLKLDEKVRFLPYETIDEIDAFFDGPTRGLNVETIVGKSEAVL